MDIREVSGIACGVPVRAGRLPRMDDFPAPGGKVSPIGICAGCAGKIGDATLHEFIDAAKNHTRAVEKYMAVTGKTWESIISTIVIKRLHLRLMEDVHKHI